MSAMINERLDQFIQTYDEDESRAKLASDYAHQLTQNEEYAGYIEKAMYGAMLIGAAAVDYAGRAANAAMELNSEYGPIVVEKVREVVGI
mmetsp:Transcript_110968/g.155810  ORF Transcript_110968/g.155810 Transcript_110968/m.155810 type:complete len:90 (-) Transcript_110968:142-411(-)